MELLSILTILICIALTTFYLYSRYKLSYWTRRGIEQLPNPHIIFGHVKDAILARTAPGLHMSLLYQSATPEAPYVGFYMFHKPCLLIRDPKLAKHMFATDFEVFCDRHYAGSAQLDSLGLLNLFGLHNPSWKFLRTKMSPLFTKGKMKGMFPLMLETSETMIEYLKHKSTVQENSDVKKVDIQDLMFKLAIDSVSNITLGTQTDSFHDADSDYTKEVLCMFHGSVRMRALLTVFFMPEIVKYFGSMVLYKLKYSARMFWEGFQARYAGQTAPRNDFLDALVSLKNSEPSPMYKFEGENLFSLASMIFSGMESCATAGSFTLLQVARNPKIQIHVRKEIKETITKYGWSIEAFTKMKYLEQCIYEGLRMYPPVTILDRIARADYHIPNTDVVLEKGVSAFISLYGMHSNEVYFPDHKIFNPDRFANSKKPIAFMGLGVGPRMCAGVNMTLVYMKLALSIILMHYEIYQHLDCTNDLDKRGTFSVVANGIEVFYRPVTEQLDENSKSVEHQQDPVRMVG